MCVPYNTPGPGTGTVVTMLCLSRPMCDQVPADRLAPGGDQADPDLGHGGHAGDQDLGVPHRGDQQQRVRVQAGQLGAPHPDIDRGLRHWLVYIENVIADDGATKKIKI